MPNTLAHLGINGIISKSLFKNVDLLLVYIGAIIPDIPWIIQRILITIIPGINPYDLRLYSIVNSSLLFSLIFCLTSAIIIHNSSRGFLILALGSSLHLLLDSLETKWGNGVHLFAPLNWDLMNYGFFWPECFFISFITLLGFAFVTLNLKIIFFKEVIQFQKSVLRLILFFVGLLTYFLSPFLFLSSSESADNHFVKTLRERENRTGKYFEIDRGNYLDNGIEDKFVIFSQEEFIVANIDLDSSEKMSIKAKFLSEHEIEIIEYHIHSNRDIYSYIGLLIVFIVFIKSMIIKNIAKKLG